MVVQKFLQQVIDYLWVETKNLFCVVGFSVFVNATTGTLLVAADIWLRNVLERGLFQKKKWACIAAILWMRLVLHAMLNVASKSMMKIKLLRLRK